MGLEELMRKAKMKIVGTLVGISILGIAASPLYIKKIPPGYVGVREWCGKIDTQEYKPGFYFKIPIVETYHKMSTRTQEIKETTKVPTKEGLMATLDVSFLYHINPSKADEIYTNIGPSEIYKKNFIIPTARSAIRDVIANYDASDLYSGNRGKISEEISQKLKKEWEERGIILEDVLLRDVKLPKGLSQAIEEKLRAQQYSKKMEYIVNKEELESKRKVVEAQGIADAIKITGEALHNNPEYLQWYYINTMKQLVDSPNNTVVILPYGTGIVPLLDLKNNNIKTLK